MRIPERYDSCRDTRTALFPGAVDVLTWLRGSGCRLALLRRTAPPTLNARKIERFRLAPLFDLILMEGKSGFGKPDERIYRLALTELAAAPHRTWMIGDNLEFDVGQPQKLGITGIWVNATGADVPAKLSTFGPISSSTGWPTCGTVFNHPQPPRRSAHRRNY